MTAAAWPSHFVSCTRLPGACCASCHDEENEGHNNLYIENVDVGPSIFVGVRSCCVKDEVVRRRVERLTERLRVTGRRW